MTGTDEPVQRFKVIHPPGVHVQEHPEQKSMRLCLLGHGEVIDTFGWDRSQSYRKVRVQNDTGQIMEGWVQVRSEVSGILLERQQPVVVAPAPAMKEDMDIETVMEMKRQLEEKLRQLQGGQPPAPVPAEGGAPSPRQDSAAANSISLAPGQDASNLRASRFAAYAQDCGVAIGGGAAAVQLEESEDLPPRSSVGQLYEVVHSPKVAVRQLPSLNSPCIRSVFRGMRVELFEWDNTRQWRRVPVDRAIEPAEVMDGDDDMDGTVRTDGWILIEHPTFGPLMQAVSPHGAEDPDELPYLDDWVAFTEQLTRYLRDRGISPKGPEAKQIVAQWMARKQAEQEGAVDDQTLGSPRQAAFAVLEEGQAWMEEQLEVATAAAGAQDGLAQEAEALQQEGQSAEPLPPLEGEGQEEPSPPEPEGARPVTMEDKIKAWEQCWIPSQSPFSRVGPPPKPDKEAQRKEMIRRAELAHEEEVIASVEERQGLMEPRLMRAVRSGNYEVVRRMLSRCPDVHESDTLGETALFEASVSGRCDMVALLLLCKADPSKASKEGVTAVQLCNDALTLALLTKWDGGDVDKRTLLGAMQLVNQLDQRRTAAYLGIPEEEVVAFLDRPPDKPPEKPPEVPAADRAPQEPQGAPSPRSQGAPSPRGAAPASEGAPSPTGDAAADAAVEENDVPERTEVGKTYQVIYKMVAVRRHPDTKAESIRAMKKGTKVVMYEYDRTRMWRRVRVEAPKSDEAGDDAVLVEVDGWMLLRSEKVGLLLQEIQEEEDEESEDEDAAG